jgi:acyl-CoA synthetase (AMP-forming)/AMP-acid ligase II
MTTVIPDMDASRPASVDPQAIVSAVEDWKITQSFASPSVWNVVGRYCEENDLRLPTLKRVLSAGAPVPNHVLARLKRVIHDEGDIFTPYGATESLPIASISASEVLNDTGHATASGSGTCVGRRYSAVDWKVIRIVDGPIETLDQVEEIPRGEVGELIVAGPMVTKRYVTRVAENALAKIDEHGRIWHRIGDVGYLDDQERFWFCGRKAHRVQTSDGVMYTVPCEAIFNNHPGIFRSALVGVGKVGEHRPVMICEPENWTGDESEQEKLIDELHGYGQDNWLTNRIRREDILLHESLPVDIRHNAKIFREKLSVWAKDKLS